MKRTSPKANYRSLVKAIYTSAYSDRFLTICTYSTSAKEVLKLMVAKNGYKHDIVETNKHINLYSDKYHTDHSIATFYFDLMNRCYYVIHGYSAHNKEQETFNISLLRSSHQCSTWSSKGFNNRYFDTTYTTDDNPYFETNNDTIYNIKKFLLDMGTMLGYKAIYNLGVDTRSTNKSYIIYSDNGEVDASVVQVGQRMSIDKIRKLLEPYVCKYEKSRKEPVVIAFDSGSGSATDASEAVLSLPVIQPYHEMLYNCLTDESKLVVNNTINEFNKSHNISNCPTIKFDEETIYTFNGMVRKVILEYFRYNGYRDVIFN